MNVSINLLHCIWELNAHTGAHNHSCCNIRSSSEDTFNIHIWNCHYPQRYYIALPVSQHLRYANRKMSYENLNQLWKHICIQYSIQYRADHRPQQLATKHILHTNTHTYTHSFSIAKVQFDNLYTDFMCIPLVWCTTLPTNVNIT